MKDRRSAKTVTIDEEDGKQFCVDDDYYASLKNKWIQEMLNPELLQWDQDLLEMETELLEGQEETIEHLHEQAERKDSSLAALVASLYQTDANRVRYMLTDWLSTRLDKVERHALYNRELVDRMSDLEVSHLKSYGELLERHLHRSVVDHIPKDAWKKLDEPEMVDKPKLDEFVFCRVLEEIEISDQDHQKGACLIAKYSSIRDQVMEGRIELLM